MYAELVQQLPNGKDWLYEVKFDGYRCLAGRDSSNQHEHQDFHEPSCES
jgi:ATP-dependent DNA ligase